MKKTNQAGFTVIEVVIAITLVGLLVAMIAPMFASTSDASRKYETERRLKDVKQTILAAYRINAFEIDTEAGAEILVNGVPVLMNGTVATKASLAWAESFAVQSSGVLYRDGYGKPWHIFVSNRLANTLNGNTVYSHRVAFVSEGRNGRLDTGTTFEPTSGLLTLVGDDVGEVADGFEVQRELFDVTLKRLDQLAKAYEAYFLTRFQSNESRNLNVNYFVNAPRSSADPAMFDTLGTISHSDGGDAHAEALFNESFGLSPSDYLDGYGRPILVDNSSDAVRTPDNSASAMQAAPYTAIIKAAMPGGVTLAQSVVGSY